MNGGCGCIGPTNGHEEPRPLSDCDSLNFQGACVPHGSNQILIVFIINGTNFSLETNVNAPLKEAVARALSESGNSGRPPSEWQVRDTTGVLLELNRKIEDFHFANGTRLFLTLAVGAGGRF